MKEITFEQVPAVVGEMSERLERMEKILNNLSPSASSEDGFMTIAEASTYLKLTASTIYGKVCRNEIPYLKKGKRLYFEKDKLSQWVHQGVGADTSTLEEKIEKANTFFQSLRASTKR